MRRVRNWTHDAMLSNRNVHETFHPSSIFPHRLLLYILCLYKIHTQLYSLLTNARTTHSQNSRNFYFYLYLFPSRSLCFSLSCTSWIDRIKEPSSSSTASGIQEAKRHIMLYRSIYFCYVYVCIGPTHNSLHGKGGHCERNGESNHSVPIFPTL